jgi:uncharacterized membrane protein YbhN (UPF0104 family)
VLGGIAFSALRPSVPARWSGRFANRLRHGAAVWNLLGTHPALGATVCLVSVGVVALQALKLYVAFCAVNADVAFAGVLMATILSELALLISITPGAIGFREAAVAASAAWLGCSPETALAAAVLDRLVMTAAIVLLAQAGTWWLSAVAAGGPSKSQPPSVDG